MKSILVLLVTILVFSSCEKVIDLDLTSSSSQLVIEGNITDQAGPYYVKLTKSVPFDESSNYPVVEDALVVISDNAGVTDTLTYTADGIYQTNILQGVPGRTYTLEVVTEGKSYAAESLMAPYVAFDSIRVSAFEFAGTIQNVIVPVYKDPVNVGNNYFFVLKVNDVLDNSYMLWNDNTNNGILNQRPLNTRTTIESGDNISLEMQSLNIDDYNYYFTLSQIAGNGPGGGTTPTNPPNNITGGALGLFSAHTSQTKTTVIP
jgi:hypothetical protein